MAKKVETIVTLTDDLDGSKAERTIAFAVDGTGYEIDLSKRNASAFEKALAPYVGAARKVRAQPRARRGAGSAVGGRRSDLGAIREWARSNGYDVSDRGRISANVVEAYDAAQ